MFSINFCYAFFWHHCGLLQSMLLNGVATVTPWLIDSVRFSPCSQIACKCWLGTYSSSFPQKSLLTLVFIIGLISTHWATRAPMRLSSTSTELFSKSFVCSHSLKICTVKVPCQQNWDSTSFQYFYHYISIYHYIFLTKPSVTPQTKPVTPGTCFYRHYAFLASHSYSNLLL